ncbi:MAG: glycosyltransferase family 2 protein [Acidimicrobiales bacterium]|nr:glycosyltransferase family 2 protein [Acidimicrobiales bacterium]
MVELARAPGAWARRGRPARLRGLGRIGDDERLIGMLMVRDEDDVLDESLAAAARWFDRIYVLDGTTDPDRVARTDAILAGFAEVRWHARDEEWFPEGVTDGARQVLLNRIRAENGVDNWIGLLHADEFIDQDPRPMLSARHPAAHPSIRVRVAHTFLHVDDEPRWKDGAEEPLRARVAHQMWPGVPESRFFFDDGSRDFDVARHSKVLPRSHRAGELVDGFVVTQYNERSPDQVLARARQRADSDWQVGHYARLLADEPEVFVTTLDRPDAPFAPEFAGDPEGPFVPRRVSATPSGPGPHAPRACLATELTDPEDLDTLRARGLVERRFSRVARPGGLVDLAERGTPRQLARAVRALGRPGALGHPQPIPGAAALVRHTARVVASDRTTPAQRRRAMAECVVRLCNADAETGWFTVVPANRRASVAAFLELERDAEWS